jgi:hypothetical protein
MFRFTQLFIDILSKLHLLPKCQLLLDAKVSKLTNAIDKNKKELTKIKQELQATTLNLKAAIETNKKLTVTNDKLDDSYKNIFLSERIAKEDLAKITRQLTETNIGLETASLENIQLQFQLDEAMEQD